MQTNDSKKKFKPYNCPPSDGVYLTLQRLSQEFPALVVDDLIVKSDTKIDLTAALRLSHQARLTSHFHEIDNERYHSQFSPTVANGP